MADYGRWHVHIEKVLAERDDLSIVANIRTSQIKKLKAAGASTVHELACMDGDNAPRIGATTVGRLKAQARLQLASAGASTPLYEVVPPPPDRPRQCLAMLPPASKHDVVFEVEGYPLVDGGLE